ncbi:Azurin [Pseudomonas marincola]|uniref:Plastocyanin n=1 Tax=Pseudomonas marincola TaxID=437900 RepID=A0A653E7N2_9PSED|nr:MULTISPECIES: cupredoxin family protein [Pseudomonas]CAE6914753.1 Azurin [Pseudomonas marincola]
MFTSMTFSMVAVATAISMASSAMAAQGHDDSHAMHHDMQGEHTQVNQQKPWGIAGNEALVTRTVELRMNDQMMFVPAKFDVQEGETIRVVLHNDGKVVHEYVLGTQAELDAHAAMMASNVQMEHHQPYMVHVAPGETGEMIWNFNRTGVFDFACLIAGHYQAGMVGKVNVVAASQ